MQDRLISELLDSLGIALCIFDADAHTLAWNQSFLRFFPEHDGFVHVGESYADNLRRFYAGRLPADELPRMERYVADGIARNHAQARPYVFQHRGRWLRVGSLPDAKGRRVRIWIEIASPAQPAVMPFDLVGNTAPQDASSFENVADGVMVLDPSDRVLSFNQAFARLYGLASGDAVVGRSYRDLLARVWAQAGVDGPSPAWAAALDDNIRFQGAPFEIPLPGERWIRVAVHPTQDLLQYSVHADITALKRQQRELLAAEHHARESEERLRALAAELQMEKQRLESSEARFRGAFDQAGIATCMLDAASLRFVAVNDALCRLLGAARDPLLKTTFDAVADLAGVAALRELTAGLRAGHTQFLQREGRMTRADASSIEVQLSFTPIRDAHGAVAMLMVHVEDIRLRKRAEEQRDHLLRRLEHQATHDNLTGLANRALLQQRLSEFAIAAPPGDASAAPARHALFFLDLDGFKQINDSAGHAAGDTALQQVAALFTACVRPHDLVARIGGDEFSVVLWDCEASEARVVADRMRQALQDRGFDWHGTRHAMGVSIGIYLFGASDTPDTAMAQADGACYAAKRAGRNQVCMAGEPKPAA